MVPLGVRGHPSAELTQSTILHTRPTLALAGKDLREAMAHSTIPTSHPWISLWFFVTVFIIFWDAGYCFLRYVPVSELHRVCHRRHLGLVRVCLRIMTSLPGHGPSKAETYTGYGGLMPSIRTLTM